MRFDLKKPCQECPFRTDSLEGWLTEQRAREIDQSLFGYINGPFPCHKTFDYEAESAARELAEDSGSEAPHGAGFTKQTQHCAGALILMEKEQHWSDVVQIAERLSHIGAEVYYDPTALDMSAPVFDSREEFIQHHKGDIPNG